MAEQQERDEALTGWELSATLARLRRLLRGFTSSNGADGDAPVALLPELIDAVDALQAGVTEAHRSNEWLVREQRRLSDLFQLAPDAYIITDVNAVITDLNRPAAQLLGGSPEIFRGKPIAAYVHDPQGVHFHIRPLHRGDQVVQWEAQVSLRGGRATPVSIRAAASRDSRGAVQDIRWMLHDITDRMERENIERIRSREHAERLGALEKRKGDFLRLASHELRSPLSVIFGYLTMSLAGDFGEMSAALRDALSIAVNESQFMARLISQMLDTARLDDARLRLDEAAADLRELVAAAYDAPVNGVLREQRCRLELELSDAPVPVRVDRERITGVVRNLLDNAIKYAPQGPIRCSVVTDPQRKAGIVSVSDSGPGIDEEARATLFQRFGRVVTEKTTAIPGTGLGLYISREMARLHDGDLRLESTSPGGSTFVLELPLCEAAGRT